MSKHNKHVQLMDIAIGKKIRTLRVAKGLTRQELADIIGITHQQLYKYEHGINRISASRIYDISKALTTNISFFFQDKEEDVAKDDALTQRAHLEMMRDYVQIDSSKQQDAIRQLIHSLANSTKIS